MTRSSAMKALVYQGPGQKVWEPVPTPTIAQPTDAIVKIAKTTICGTDLHILKGDVPAVTSGRILGHEAVGIVDEVGAAVRNCKKGDRVLISCITSCGKCEYCKRQMYAHCEDGGWILGHRINGTQAEYVRIPHADNSLYLVPAGADEEALVMLSDILPTGFAVEGSWPRRRMASTWRSRRWAFRKPSMSARACHIANVGVHGKSVDFQIQKLWIQNITLTTGLVNTNTTPMLLKTVESGRLHPEQLISHHFTFDQFAQAYDVFSNAAKEKALKVLIANT